IVRTSTAPVVSTIAAANGKAVLIQLTGREASSSRRARPGPVVAPAATSRIRRLRCRLGRCAIAAPRGPARQQRPDRGGDEHGDERVAEVLDRGEADVRAE